MIACVRLRITGRVQGVWFRGSMQQEAERLGVGGWARNMPDGSVEAVVEGEADAVRALVVWAHSGPSGAHVLRVVETREPPAGNVTRFVIRH